MIKSKWKKTIIIGFLLIVTGCCVLLFPSKTYAAASQAELLEPDNCQTIPFYEVWIRWNDVNDEDHYKITVRDITDSDTGPLLYTSQYVSQNSSYFIIPLDKLGKGRIYRWSLCSVDSTGKKTFSPPRTFRIETGLSTGEDSHLLRTGYASASHIDYFIHAPTSGYDSVIQSCVDSWNGISSNVYLHRDYGDDTKELGIYENYNPINSSIWGKTYLGGSGYSVSDAYAYNIVTYTEIALYIGNMGLSDYNDFNLRYTTLHEVGHALSLAHTNGVDENATPNAPASNNTIAKTYDLLGTLTKEEKKDISLDNVYLVMNQGGAAIRGTISTTDKDHLRIKWGA